MMQQQIVGMIAAMPEEVSPLLKRAGRYRREQVQGCTLYRFTLGETPVALIESGMGPEHAAFAARVLLAQVAPRLILNFGFGGGVRPGLAAGDLVLAQRVLWLEDGSLREAPAPDAALNDRLFQLAQASAIRVFRGTFVTSARITGKEVASALLSRQEAHPVLEMETAAIAEVAARAGIPVVALRGISDPADEELAFSLEEFTDSNLNLKISRVLATVLARPRIIPQLIRLSGNARKAGNNLALCLGKGI